jgi:histone-lysine N-methyltransferase SETMAR
MARRIGANEWSKEEVRGVVRFLWAKDTAPTDIHRELTNVYGDGVMSVQSVRKWCRYFEAGHSSLKDEDRSGRPSTSEDIVSLIDDAVKENRRVTLAQLQTMFAVSHGTLWDIVHDRLGYRKVCARWVPRQLLPPQKEARMGTSLAFLLRYEAEGEEFLRRIVTGDETWVHHFEPQSKAESMTWKHPQSPVTKKFKVARSAGKIMATVFWDMEGVLLVDYTPKGETINAAAYEQSLMRLKSAIRRKRPGLLRSGVLLLHDNARPHVANKIKGLLQGWRWEVIDHPPYSPDLAPSDFHLFGKLKKNLRGQRFETNDEAKAEVNRWLRAQSPEFYKSGIEALVPRLDKCLNNGGDYVEK